jgi:hypothetical protein
LLENLDRIMRYQAQVRDSSLSGREQAMANAGLVNLDTQIILSRAFFSLLHQRFAIAEAYFKYDRHAPTTYRLQVERLSGERNTTLGHQFVECFLLRGSHAPGAAHKAADRA